ncbi:hypothetical protein [Vibrio cholerae]|uniref:hypothetical protein n=1 Tax=Vibrio cholerae TaxID=666 RepID=UPI000BA95F3B|nr:hypothetical protein [Vibrio cholerae]PAR92346.1 hypothetical protein CGT82_17150 [Vibrio cholerae]
MDVLDKISITNRKLIVFISCILALLIVVMSVFLFIKFNNKNELALKKKQEIEIENRQKKHYQDVLYKIEKSVTLDDSLIQLNNIYNDKTDLEELGWDFRDFNCKDLYCNVRFERQNGNKFKYVEIVKGEDSYKPIFGENELIFENIKYLPENDAYKIDKNKLNSCTDVISSIYEFKSIIGNRYSDEFNLSEPSGVFSIDSKYQWATLHDLKKIDMELKFDNVIFIRLIGDSLSKEKLFLNSFSSTQDMFDVGLTVYCL